MRQLQKCGGEGLVRCPKLKGKSKLNSLIKRKEVIEKRRKGF